MVTFNSWILYHYLGLVNYFLNVFWVAWKKIIQWNCFLRNNIDFLTNLSADQTDLQFQIPNLKQNLRSAIQ